MPRRTLILPALVLIVGIAWDTAPAGDDDAPKKLEMTEAVACRVVRGFGDYDEVGKEGQTRDEKLQVYYEPSNYQYEKVKKEYQIHFTQDARIRKRGQKAVLMAKDKLMDFKDRFDRPPTRMYLSNSISLKNLPPGDYDLEIILRDEIGKSPAVRQVMPFRVRAAVEPKPEDKATPPGPKEKSSG